MAEQHSIAEARNRLPSLVREAESGRAVELTRRGEPVAVLISHRQYARLRSKDRRFSEAYRAFVKVHDLEELAIEPDEIFAATRDDTGGRKVEL